MRQLPYSYKCPQCGKKVSVLSNKYPPICRNKEVHSTKEVEMEPQNDAVKKANH